VWIVEKDLHEIWLGMYLLDCWSVPSKGRFCIFLCA